MPVKGCGINPTVDRARVRYYRARADRIEQENADFQKNLIATKQIESDLQAFCAAIETKIRLSELGPELQKELFEDLADFPRKVSVNGSNGKLKAKRRSTRRERKP